MQPRAHLADFLRGRPLLTIPGRSSVAFLVVFFIFAGAFITTRYLDFSTKSNTEWEARYRLVVASTASGSYCQRCSQENAHRMRCSKRGLPSITLSKWLQPIAQRMRLIHCS